MQHLQQSNVSSNTSTVPKLQMPTPQDPLHNLNTTLKEFYLHTWVVIGL